MPEPEGPTQGPTTLQTAPPSTLTTSSSHLQQPPHQNFVMNDSKTGYMALPTEAAPPPAYSAAQEARPAESVMRDVLNRTERILLQPGGVQPMQIGGARNAKGLEIGLDGKRDWNHNLLACHQTPGLTLQSCFCTPCLYQSNHKRLAHLQQTGEPLDGGCLSNNVGLSCGLYTLASQLFGVGHLALQCISRTQTRQRYSVRGNVVEDLATALLCTACVQVQEAREIADEEAALRQGAEGPEVFFEDEADEEEEQAAVVEVAVVESAVANKV